MNAINRRSARWVRAVLLVPLALLLVAWRSGCSRSVGVWPNYVWVSPSQGAQYIGGGSEMAVESATDSKGIAHIMLFVGWIPDWYTSCTSGPCPLAQGTNGNSLLYNYVYNGIRPYSSSSYSREYNISLVLNLHKQLGSTQLGPDSVQSNVTGAFDTFFSEIYKVMKLTEFSGATWAISIGNEVDNFLNVTNNPSQTATNWANYQTFATAANTYIENTTGGGLTIWTGVTMTYYGSALPAVSNPNHPSIAMSTVGSLAIMTYYPFVDCSQAPALCPNTGSKGGFRMAGPMQPTLDFPNMVQYLSMVNTKRSAANLAGAFIFLQEVGYPTETAGQAAGDLGCPDVAGASCDPTSANATLEGYQAQFVDSVFQQFNANTSTMRAFTWWSLFDYTKYSAHGCSPYWATAVERLCYMGLLHSDGSQKQAYSHFTSQLASFTP